ncbi:GTPase Der [Clostridia bacterium]|nr:GTPase Der [Clostridia bacterium]
MAVFAIVGRPNVGKSALFNKLIGRRLSIVDDFSGVTRDRVYAKSEWLGKEFTLIDTGGFADDRDIDDEKSGKGVLNEVRAQVFIAIEQADVIVMLCDLQCGVTANDAEVAAMLRKSGKPVILAVNKCDSVGAVPAELYEFYSLGLGEPYPVSAVHGHGSGDMLDVLFGLCPNDRIFPAEEKKPRHNRKSGKKQELPEKPAESESALPEESELQEKPEEIPHIINVAVVGRPNAGKSTLINKLLGENRVIVSEIAGTTRDSIDVEIVVGNSGNSETSEESGQRYNFIDTAGIRRKSKVRGSGDVVEKYSVMRAVSAVERADVVVLLIDGSEGFAEQDAKVAGYAHESGKPTLIAVNKWDTRSSEDNKKLREEITNKVREGLSYMSYAPVVFISGKTGENLPKLFPLINDLRLQNSRRITTGALNDLLGYATSRVQPPTDRGNRLKLYYITQASSEPPTFVVFCNRIDLFHFSYQRYIENQIRKTFSLTHTPVVIVPRERGTNTGRQDR